ncbi:Male sterility, NAD-binding protein [Senna tora]|uniref:Fatty acyl-CoA reductase n=1 Tax=Senna tora TaxID=362788 RepID=A0A834WFC8_9FABA|nr:Male sterility, NAD-binding protein [Senna tora]
MELGATVPHFLKGKTILVTGAAGFLAKVFVEKLLRTQSHIKKLYLLVRASDADVAKKRLHDEILRKDLFKVLREKWGKDFDSFISKKVTALAGDVSAVNLGIKDANLQTKLTEEIDVIVNLAATTNFDERAKLYGWPNTYVFTKAMGEMLLSHFKDNIPLIIIRPTMVTSTYKEPFPGWIEGFSFDDTNTERLRMATKENDDVGFYDLEFDPKSIDWTHYMMNVHIPGLIKNAVK